MPDYKRFLTVLAVLFLLLTLAPRPLPAAPAANLWPRWQTHDPASKLLVDHRAWQHFLEQYLDSRHPSGINRLRYGQVGPNDRQALAAYLAMLQKTPVSRLNRAEQLAYWINLYNALTVQVILDHYPVASIRDIDISPGLFSDGPWGRKLLLIEGEELSLDDIEHRILRPIWRDSRLHYAVNCASLGCPNLQPQAFTAANTETLLNLGARQYINHPRGLTIQPSNLRLSAIYRWFAADFGDRRKHLLDHLAHFLDDPAQQARVRRYTGPLVYHYDWQLNE